ncbi:MAG: class I tRNA ligase family protein, partial [Chrysiogenetes bacterium]|nr:class I tRNA ligase family protein [Chrysiogenetes bacterium]
ASRFAMMNLGDETPTALPPSDKLSTVEKWILFRLEKAIGETTNALDSYEFDRAASTLYQFTWQIFCDWYLELAKPDLNGEHGEERRDHARAVLSFVLQNMLRMLHPMVPFVTEEIAQKLGAAEGYLMRQSWPSAQDVPSFPHEAEAFDKVVDAIAAVRSVRGELGVKPSSHVELHWNDAVSEKLSPYSEHFVRLAKVSTISAAESRPASAAAVAEPFEFFITFPDGIDVEAERARVGKARTKNEKEIGRLEGKLSNENFRARAPEEEVEKQEGILEGLKEERARLDAAWKTLEGMK